MTTFHISPEPTPEVEAAIVGAVTHLLADEERHARPSPWRVDGWVAQRRGIRDLGHHMSPHRRWALSARLPWGGRTYPGMGGRGDAK